MHGLFITSLINSKSEDSTAHKQINYRKYYEVIKQDEEVLWVDTEWYVEYTVKGKKQVREEHSINSK